MQITLTQKINSSPRQPKYESDSYSDFENKPKWQANYEVREDKMKERIRQARVVKVDGIYTDGHSHLWWTDTC